MFFLKFVWTIYFVIYEPDDVCYEEDDPGPLILIEWIKQVTGLLTYLLLFLPFIVEYF